MKWTKKENSTSTPSMPSLSSFMTLLAIMIPFHLLESRNSCSVFHFAEFSWDITKFALTAFVIENNRGTEQIAINYRLLQEDIRGHRDFESGWLLQITETACFPRDRKPKSSQLFDIVVIKQGWHHIYKSRSQYSHALTKHFRNGITDVVQTAYIARSHFIMSCLHFVHKANYIWRPHVSPDILLHGLIV
jgi:hypothetical protein